MGRKITAILVFILSLSLFAAGCAKYKVTPLSGNYKSETPAVSNGGFVANYGEYTYFINGIDYNYSDNTFGKPVKAALMRVKTADILKETAEFEIVVPRLMVSGTNKQGFFIDGDYVYYATPTTAKDKKRGEVQYNYLDITRTKLDGTDTLSRPFFRLENNATDYRFVKTQSSIYVVYVEASTLYSYDTVSGKKITLAEDAESYVMPHELGSQYFYYTKTIKTDPDNDDSTLENFNEVYQVSADGSTNRLIISGLGVARSELSDPDFLMHLENKKITIVKAADDYLYATVAEEQKGDTYGAIFRLSEFLYSDDGTDSKEIENFYKMSKVDKIEIFTAAALYENADKMYYLSTGVGIMRYDVASGESYPIYKDAADSLTLLFTDGGYLYFSKAGSIGDSLLRIDYTGENHDYEYYTDETPKIKAEQIGSIAFTSNWYLPEIIDGILFYANAADLGYNYIFAYDLANISDEEYEPVFIGIRNAADQKSYDLAKEEEEKN